MKSSKLFALTLAVLTSFSVMTGCSSKDKPVDTGESVSQTETQLQAITNDKPVLSVSKLEISESTLNHTDGTPVTVDYSVSGITDGWSSSGIHIAYDNRIQLQFDEFDDPVFEAGEASKDLTNLIIVKWKGENPPAQLEGKNMDNLSVITAGSSDKGTNGVIASITFLLPPDAKAGDEYKLEFFKYEIDSFTNFQGDEYMQNYAFENWENGYIRITE